MKAIEIPEILNLSIPEKILLLEDLWDSISSDEAEIPIPDSHKVELERRLKNHLDAPGKLLTLEELTSRIDKNK